MSSPKNQAETWQEEYQYAKPPVNYVESLIYDRFKRRNKIVIKGDRGVLTATDTNMFVGLQLLYYSLTLSHEVRFAVMDLGMDEDQLAWCMDKSIQILPMPTNLIFPDKTINYWQTWNKPQWIENSPFGDTLWLDVDVIVRGSLEHAFEVTSSRPFLVECVHSAPGFFTKNQESLYNLTKKMFVKERASIFPNAGVFGIVPKRDSELLGAWKFAVEQAHEFPVLQSKFSWYDQGALIWALEKTKNTNLVRMGEWTYNCPGRLPLIYQYWKCRDVVEFLEELPKSDTAVIRHYTSIFKPWSLWDQEHRRFPIDLSDSLSSKLKVLILGHHKIETEFAYPRSYHEFVNLNKLDIGEHQRNELAESRIYLEPNLMDRFDGKEYVGFASQQWDDKYTKSGVPKLHELHAFVDMLSPKRVLVANPTRSEPNWIEVTCKENPGMEDFLLELREFTGMPLVKGPSFWSNNFICHKQVLEDYLVHFRKVFDHFWRKYRNRFAFVGMDSRRTPAYFYEAVTVHYFSNRTDLKFKRMIVPNRLRYA